MSSTTQKFYSFLTGVISPRMLGNSILPQYQTALQDGKNLLVGQYGYLTARPGSKYVAEVKDSSVKSYLFPFKYSNTDTYVLEFTATKIRFYENQAQIISGTPYEVTTPYSVTDIPDLRIAQSFDKIFITHHDHAPRELARISDTNWTLTEMGLDEPPYLEENLTDTTLSFSAITGTGVTCTASTGIFTSTDIGRAIRFKAGPDNTDAVSYEGGGTLSNFEIPFYPKDSTSIEVIEVATDGTETELSYVVSSPSVTEYTITNNKVELNSSLATNKRLRIQRKNTGSGEWGYATITAYSSATSVTVDIKRDLGGTNTSTYWRLGAWSNTTGYPSKIGFYQGRLWFANSVNNPDRVWASAVEDFYDFGPDNIFNKGQVDDDSAISATIAGINTITFMEGLNVLMLGGEGLKSIGKGGVAVVPPPTVLPEDATVCADIVPVVNKNEIIFADAQKKTLYSAEFDFQSNSYRPFNLNLLADHIFEASPIKEITMTNLPFPVVWALREDGQLYACTYDKSQNLSAWVKQEIGGTDVEVESITSIASNNKSELWCVVKRTIDGATARYIEVVYNHFFEDDKTEATFSDSYITYSGASTTTLTGLDHLEGEEVEVIGNGGVMTGKTVSGGSITLDSAVTTATVGLAYSKYGKTVPLDTGKINGPAKGTKGRIREVMIDFFETDGCKVRINDDALTEINFRGSGLLGGSVNPLSTGYSSIAVSNTYSTALAVYFEQPYALPFTIRSISMKVDISNN